MDPDRLYDAYDDFDDDDLVAEEAIQQYRNVDGLAVAALVAGFLSLLALFHWALFPIPVAAMVLAWRGWQRIEAAPEERTGRPLAGAAVAMAFVFWAGSWGWGAYSYLYEIPSGYQRVSYNMLQPDPDDEEEIPEAARELDTQRIFIFGYMYPGRQIQGLTEFLMSPARADCPYCIPNPKPTEIIHVRLVGDRATTFTTKRVGVGGVFHVDRSEKYVGAVYRIDADIVR